MLWQTVWRSLTSLCQCRKLSCAAQLLGLVGSARKRILLLWQAVWLSKYLGFPSEQTLEVILRLFSTS